MVEVSGGSHLGDEILEEKLRRKNEEEEEGEVASLHSQELKDKRVWGIYVKIGSKDYSYVKPQQITGGDFVHLKILYKNYFCLTKPSFLCQIFILCSIYT